MWFFGRLLSDTDIIILICTSSYAALTVIVGFIIWAYKKRHPIPRKYKDDIIYLYSKHYEVHHKK